MKVVKGISLILIVIGAINWGLLGLFQFDLVASLFGGHYTALSRVVYTIIGVAGIIGLSFFRHIKCICCCCSCTGKGPYNNTGKGPYNKV